MPTPTLLRGLDSAAHLYDWLTARGQQRIVVDVVDVLYMTRDDQLLYLELCQMWGLGFLVDAGDNDTLRRIIKGTGFRGYQLWPVDRLAAFSLDQLGVVQGFLHAYLESRRGRGKHTIKKPCCGKPSCKECGGAGYTLVLEETSALERALAEGRSWDDIDKEGLSA